MEHTISALKKVHQEFFRLKSQNKSPSVCQILPAIKSKVLHNVNICFSGVIPTNVQPELHEFWILATQFGATCQTQVTLDTTHLIANRFGTDKVNMAIELNKIWVLKLDW